MLRLNEIDGVELEGNLFLVQHSGDARGAARDRGPVELENHVDAE